MTCFIAIIAFALDNLILLYLRKSRDAYMEISWKYMIIDSSSIFVWIVCTTIVFINRDLLWGVSVTLVIYFLMCMLVSLVLMIGIIKCGFSSKQNMAFILVLLAPVISFLVTELIANPDYFYMARRYRVLNIIILYIVYTILYVLFLPRKITVIISSSILVLFGIANYFITQFRSGNSILPGDLIAWRTAVNVAGSYNIVIPMRMGVSAFVFICYVGLIIWLPGLVQRRYSAIKRVMCGGILIAFVYFAFLKTNFEAEPFNVGIDFWQTKETYYTYGTPITFVSLLNKSHAKKPESYDETRVTELREQYETFDGSENGDAIEVRPTVIAIMNESLSDLRVIQDFSYEPDCLNFLNSFEEPTLKGNLLVPVYGGGTCNSEFEFLTGCSLANLPISAYPYQEYDLSKTPSLVKIFKNAGYATLAIHPGEASSWNRTAAYQQLGFERYISKSDFSDQADSIGIFMTDKSCYDRVIQEYEEREKESFIFCVTIQNHGAYDTLRYQYDDLQPIELEDRLNQYVDVKEYLSLIYETDIATEQLFEYFENVEEPVIICLFGDHQPSLSEDFYKDLYGKDISQLTVEEQEKKYLTPYFIWANYDMGEMERKDTSANYLGGILLDYSGIPRNAYFNFLLEMQEEIPMMNYNGYKDKNEQWNILMGNMGDNPWLQDYQNLQYYYMFKREDDSDS